MKIYETSMDHWGNLLNTLSCCMFVYAPWPALLELWSFSIVAATQYPIKSSKGRFKER